MQYSELGRTGLKVSRICLGTMTFGQQNTEAEGHAQLDYAQGAGVNFFDMAELYPVPARAETSGATEAIVGSWLKARGRRDDVVIASKVVGRSAMTWFRQDGAQSRLTKAQILEAIEGSLRRLGTDYIDLYQLHWPDRAIRLWGGMTFDDYADDYAAFEDTLDVLQGLVTAGKVRHVGVSNETPWGVMKFLKASEAGGAPRMVSIQNAYSLVNRTFEWGLAEIALREQVGLLAYSSLGQGYLSGKYRHGALPPKSRKAEFPQFLKRYEGPRAEEAINAYVDLAHHLGLEPAALALKFVDSRPFVTATIIGATSLDQLKANMAAFELTWTAELEAAVTALHEIQPNPCP